MSINPSNDPPPRGFVQPDEETSSRMRTLLREHGVERVSEALGLSVPTIQRLACGSRVQSTSLRIAMEGLNRPLAPVHDPAPRNSPTE